MAEIDPSMFLEPPDEEQDEVCQECGECDNEDILLYCDGCNKLWHTYCVDLDDVPYASWFCDSCSSQRSSDPQSRTSRRGRGPVGRRRTRGMERRRRRHNAVQDDGWNQVWQSVWSQLSLDLDFPFDDDESHATAMRRHRQALENSRREQEAWVRRMRVAELAGAGSRFREVASTLLDTDSHPRRGGPTQPVQESAEEVAAWNAFREARSEPAQPEVGPSRTRKRKSRTSSPTVQETSDSAPAREVKRRRLNQPTRIHTCPCPAPQTSSPIRVSPQPRPRNVMDGTAPSFLQSLLQEVEVSSGPGNITSHRPSPRYPNSPPADQQSPRPSSPATSNPSSPRALSTTPPPTINGFRPTSPPGLSSTILPVFPPANYSPQRPTSPDQKEKTRDKSPDIGSRDANGTHIARPKPRRPRIPEHALSVTRPRSHDTSPTRSALLTADAKADVQKLVSAALKPHYHEQKISKDEYTTINRDVSRMLYDKIGDFEALDLEGRARWEKVAGEEVNKAVIALRT